MRGCGQKEVLQKAHFSLERGGYQAVVPTVSCSRPPYYTPGQSHVKVACMDLELLSFPGLSLPSSTLSKILRYQEGSDGEMLGDFKQAQYQIMPLEDQRKYFLQMKLSTTSLIRKTPSL